METATYTSSNLHKYITELEHVIAGRVPQDTHAPETGSYQSLADWGKNQNPVFAFSPGTVTNYQVGVITVTDPRFTMLSPGLREKTMQVFHASMEDQGVTLPEPDGGGSHLYIPLQAGPDVINHLWPAYARALQKTLQEELDRIQQERKTAIEAFKRNAAVFKNHQSALTNALTDKLIPQQDKRTG